MYLMLVLSLDTTYTAESESRNEFCVSYSMQQFMLT